MGHYSVMCVGKNPEEIMSKYGKNKKVEPYVKYKFSDAKAYKEGAILALEKSLESKEKFEGRSDEFFDIMEMRIEGLKRMSDIDYFLEMTEGMDYDEDQNAVTDENPDGKWYSCKLATDQFYPLVLKDGTNSFSAKNSDIDWEKVHMEQSKVLMYLRVWDMVIGGAAPETDKEKIMYNHMSGQKDYLLKFGSRENYAKYCSAYWCTAFVDENGWHDAWADRVKDFNEWILNFYDRFVKDLSPDDNVMVFDCEIEFL